jgi:hypothetical protein
MKQSDTIKGFISFVTPNNSGVISQCQCKHTFHIDITSKLYNIIDTLIGIASDNIYVINNEMMVPRISFSGYPIDKNYNNIYTHIVLSGELKDNAPSTIEVKSSKDNLEPYIAFEGNKLNLQDIPSFPVKKGYDVVSITINIHEYYKDILSRAICNGRISDDDLNMLFSKNKTRDQKIKFLREKYLRILEPNDNIFTSFRWDLQYYHENCKNRLNDRIVIEYTFDCDHNDDFKKVFVQICDKYMDDLESFQFKSYNVDRHAVIELVTTKINKAKIINANLIELINNNGLQFSVVNSDVLYYIEVNC